MHDNMVGFDWKINHMQEFILHGNALFVTVFPLYRLSASVTIGEVRNNIGPVGMYFARFFANHPSNVAVCGRESRLVESGELKIPVSLLPQIGSQRQILKLRLEPIRHFLAVTIL